MIKLELNQITDKIEIEGKQYLLVEKNQLTNLLNQNAEYKKDVVELKECIISVLRLMGLLDETTKTLKAEIKSGEESYFSPILKSLSDVVKLLTLSQLPIVGKKHEEQLVQKFSFIKQILPLIEKHGK
jgi:hypothetical protein